MGGMNSKLDVYLINSTDLKRALDKPPEKRKNEI